MIRIVLIVGAVTACWLIIASRYPMAVEMPELPPKYATNYTASVTQ